MKTRHIEPSPRYAAKLRVTLTIAAALVLAAGALLGFLLSLDRSVGVRVGATVVVVTLIGDVVWWVPAMFLAGTYYRSLSYETREDEVIVRAGIWTRSVKHVPYRAVTNLTVKQGILDRWFGLGTLDIQTAGMSGSTGAEESLVGLSDAQEVYQIVAAELRRFRGSLAPTGVGLEGGVRPDAVDAAILTEVRAIRQALEER